MTVTFDYYAEPLGNGRAIMRLDIICDGELIDSHTVGSPAPIDTVRAHARRYTSTTEKKEQ